MTEQRERPRITLEPAGANLRILFGGEVLADSDAALVLREGSLPPVFYVPKKDVRWDLATPTERSTHCPYKGDAFYWSVSAGGKSAENAIWGYPDAIEAVRPIRDCVAFYWNKMDAWFLGGKALDAPPL